MALTAAQIEARRGKLTASCVGTLVSGDKERILNLWKEMIGDSSYVAPDFTQNWPVRLGETTESLNLDWYAQKTGHAVEKRGLVVQHPDWDWAAATLDGWDSVFGCPIETKHVGGWEKTDTIIQRYMPQMTWQMECTKATKCAISIIQGAAEPYVEYINYDKAYADELGARGLRFMQHVWNMTEPVEIEKAPVYLPHDQMKELNFTTNNLYADLADKWLNSRKAAKDFKEAETGLKELMPFDARRIYGRLIQVKRAKNGSIRITPLE